MHVIILLSCLLIGNTNGAERNRSTEMDVAKNVQAGTDVSITFPKNNQKVRGEYKIYGKAKPGSAVELHISSTYYKTARDNRQKISKGAGPLNRMNRKFRLTADRSGNWLLKSIELLNAGWEETFTIKATADKKTVSIRVYDNTRPVAID